MYHLLFLYSPKRSQPGLRPAWPIGVEDPCDADVYVVALDGRKHTPDQHTCLRTPDRLQGRPFKRIVYLVLQCKILSKTIMVLWDSDHEINGCWNPGEHENQITPVGVH